MQASLSRVHEFLVFGCKRRTSETRSDLLPTVVSQGHAVSQQRWLPCAGRCTCVEGGEHGAVFIGRRKRWEGGRKKEEMLERKSNENQFDQKSSWKRKSLFGGTAPSQVGGNVHVALGKSTVGAPARRKGRVLGVWVLKERPGVLPFRLRLGGLPHFFWVVSIPQPQDIQPGALGVASFSSGAWGSPRVSEAFLPELELEPSVHVAAFKRPSISQLANCTCLAS